MKIVGNENLLKYLNERNKSKENYVKELDELNAEFSSCFSKFTYYNKNYKWVLILGIIILIAFIVFGLIAEMLIQALIAFSGLWIIGLGILIFFWKKSLKKEKTVRTEYDNKHQQIKIFIDNINKLEEKAALEIPHIICKSENLEKLEDYRKNNNDNKYQIHYDELLEKTKQKIVEEKGMNYRNDDIIDYYNEWVNRLNNSDFRDYRKEKIEYLKRKELESKQD